MTKTNKVSQKKQLQLEVTQQLENSLSGLKELLGDKKFNARVKKSVKLLTRGLSLKNKDTSASKSKKEVLAEVPGADKKAVIKKQSEKIATDTIADAIK
jgi:hypothetical protein